MSLGLNNSYTIKLKLEIEIKLWNSRKIENLKFGPVPIKLQSKQNQKLVL